MRPDPEQEFPLAGGRVTTGVVRVGDTVRRPVGAHSAYVHQLFRLLENRGIGSVPRLLGIDEWGRETISFHEGWVPPNLEWRRWRDDQLASAARIVREVHDATAGSDLAGDAEVVCHGDLSPCNFVFVHGEPRFLIDFDRAHPGSRKSDLAYMAWSWLIGVEDEAHAPTFEARLAQLPLLLDGYGLVDRGQFAEAIEAEQQEILDSANRRGNSAASEWVMNEIAFARSHADSINAAAV
jgi:aminoglycoside phosphotransferase (APT) family kinase protein